MMTLRFMISFDWILEFCFGLATCKYISYQLMLFKLDETTKQLLTVQRDLKQ